MSFYEIAKKIDKILKGKASKNGVNNLLALIKDDISYQNYFFRNVKDINWFLPLKKNGYFIPNENLYRSHSDQEGDYSIPEWNVLSYLERVSQQVSIPENEKYIDDLLAIIKDVSIYRDSSGQYIDNYRTWYYFVKILLNIPNEKIHAWEKEYNIDILDFIPVWLDSKFNTTPQGEKIATKLLPKFLTDNPVDIKRAEKIIDYITTYKSVPLIEDSKKKEFRLVIDPHWLKEAFVKYSESIGEKCSKELIEKIASKIKPLLERKEDGTYTSFYDEPEYSIREPLEMFTYILKRILLSKAKADVNTTKEILKDFFENEYFYFPKMAIYIIGQNVENYGSLFWDILFMDVGTSIFGKIRYFGDELKRLLNNLKDFPDEQREILRKKIEEAAEQQTFEEDSDRRNAAYKQRIYQALSHDTYFKRLYNEMKNITGAEPELRPAIGKVVTWSGPGPSPLTKEEILRMKNDKLAEFLSTFKTKDIWRGPTVGGLADLIAGVAKDLPDKFTDDLKSFEYTGFIYVYEIMKGIKDAWNEKKDIDWAKAFEFMEVYVNRKEFWEDEFIVGKSEWLENANHEWVAGIIAELIQDGTRDDAWAFSEEYFKKAERIIFLLLDNLKAENEKEITDYVTHTLNTPFGKTITALVLLALRIARVNDKKSVKDEPRWSLEFKTKYEGLLSKGIIEAFVNLGEYLPNLYYLDRIWVEDNIKKLLFEPDKKKWEAFMSGYLSNGRVYDDLYKFMKPHYEYGLSYDFKEKHNKDHLIQHICIGYLRGREKSDDPESLFHKLIDEWKPDHIREVIGFFWMQRDYLKEMTDENEKMKGKIIEFWKLLYEKYKNNDEASLTKEDKHILSAASKLAAFLSKIDAESCKWLMKSARYVHDNYNSSFFIEYLDEIKDKGEKSETAKHIAEIYLTMLEKSTPDYDKKHIRSIVVFLYDAGAKDNADKICNAYGARGAEFLRDIYEKHNR